MPSDIYCLLILFRIKSTVPVHGKTPHSMDGVHSSWGVLERLWYVLQIETWWRHQKETFSVLLAICAGNSPSTGEFPAQRPVTRNFDVFFDMRLE